jgi:hypothetical protein
MRSGLILVRMSDASGRMAANEPHAAVAGQQRWRSGHLPIGARVRSTGSHHNALRGQLKDRELVAYCAKHGRSAMAGADELCELSRPRRVPRPKIGIGLGDVIRRIWRLSPCKRIGSHGCATFRAGAPNRIAIIRRRRELEVDARTRWSLWPHVGIPPEAVPIIVGKSLVGATSHP